jgi:hypothetical protein
MAMAGQAGLGERTPHVGKGIAIPLPLSVKSCPKLENIACKETTSCQTPEGKKASQESPYPEAFSRPVILFSII